ncbi:hypothetical protein CRV15_29430 (plasmid) [Streptomyces clavuligerus]|uniref:Uncharacterized protein n=1 Tax=Streptomyces clavuligerus TaxID=1901 RepID=B5GRW0_STRCL|nr:hypothetical protein SSCG_02084 [Streptomyces clavuligerus]EFG03756.1 Hypothetical protein SCLAV_p0265 [Streptomyces clavuligerus]QCS09743.1 hypothetical protein CRV15_29430 [Streptomyces clavuligerus]QPJ98212.1 hypothetical protein GE265_34970 [Streptomyces clavuligerus]
MGEAEKPHPPGGDAPLRPETLWRRPPADPVRTTGYGAFDPAQRDGQDLDRLQAVIDRTLASAGHHGGVREITPGHHGLPLR